MVKFSLISDMHVDFPQPRTPYEKLEQKVVVAGDTSNGLEGLRFLLKLKNKGFDVFACDGNHEHYANLLQNRSVYETQARFREEHSSVRMLTDTVPICLYNGWYPVTDEEMWQGYMNDSYRSCLSGEEVSSLAREHARCVQAALQEWKDLQYKGVVVTHTAPCEETLNPRFEGHFSNEWYWSPHMRDLLSEFKDQIHVWCHGHSHAFSDKIVDGVRVVCNPRGYPGENPDWCPFTVEI